MSSYDDNNLEIGRLNLSSNSSPNTQLQKLKTQDLSQIQDPSFLTLAYQRQKTAPTVRNSGMLLLVEEKNESQASSQDGNLFFDYASDNEGGVENGEEVAINNAHKRFGFQVNLKRYQSSFIIRLIASILGILVIPLQLML